jgi:hypothetical protein
LQKPANSYYNNTHFDKKPAKPAKKVPLTGKYQEMK